MIGLIIIGLSSTSGCLFGPTDKGWFTPEIYARFISINFTSLSDTIDEHNILYDYYNEEGGTFDIEGISLFLPDNTTYFLSNISYNISATSIGFHYNSYNSRDYWMNMGLDANKYSKYRYPSEKEALDANYLLEPSFELMKYFLNESSNPMPYKVEYGVY